MERGAPGAPDGAAPVARAQEQPLQHQPRGLDESAQAGVELQLSGHTHGGQLFPWSLLVGAVYPYWKGLYTHAEEGAGSGQIYVSCGTGYWGPPMRLGAPAEITKIVLT